MRFKRVLLINQKFFTHFSVVLPIGLAYIAEVLRRDGYAVSILDLNLGYTITDVCHRIDEFKPDLVGMTMYTFGYKYSYEVLSQIKEAYPDVSLIIGGPHISILHEKVLEECPAIDFGVVQEGEETILDLCSGDKEFREIPGFIYRDEDGQIQFTGNRTKFVMNLDQIPFPTYDGFEVKKYTHAAVNMITTRGCPYQCIFCEVENVSGRKYRMKSGEYCVEEMRYLHNNLGFNYIDIYDDDFAQSKRRTLELTDAIQSSGIHKEISFTAIGVRCDTMNEEILRNLKAARFESLCFGVESANDRILRILKKSETMDKMDNAVRLSTQMGIKVVLFFIIGTPGETEEDVMRSIAFATKYPVYAANFYNLIPVPGTELYSTVEKDYGFLVQPERYLNDASIWVNTPYFETPELPAEKRSQLYAYANTRAADHVLETRKRFYREETSRKFARLGLHGALNTSATYLYTHPLLQKTLNNPITNAIKRRVGLSDYVFYYKSEAEKVYEGQTVA